MFEGEGCIYCDYNTDARDNARYLRIKLSLQMVDKDVVERFQSIIGGRVHASRPLPSGKIAYRWHTTSRKDFLRIINLFLPFLGERRRNKALTAIDMINEREATPRRGHSEQGKKNISEGLRLYYERISV